MTDFTQALYFLLALVIAIDIHEFFHAWIADRLGDPTARYMGRVSLNPIVHLDPLGSLMMLFMALGGVVLGWGKPVPVNPNNLRQGPIVGEAIVSVCGPLSNLLTAAIVAIPLRLAMSGILPRELLSGSLGTFLIIVFLVSISLAVFNLLPIFPLDGYHFWLGVLHELPFDFTRQLWFTLSGTAFQTYGPVILLALIFLGRGVLSSILSPIINVFATLFLGLPLF